MCGARQIKLFLLTTTTKIQQDKILFILLTLLVNNNNNNPWRHSSDERHTNSLPIRISQTLELLLVSRSSSVSTVSDYRLEGWGSIPGRGKGFFL
jgi:hypothetical protein